MDPGATRSYCSHRAGGPDGASSSGMLKPSASPKLNSADVLEALGLERRHSRGRDVAFAIGLALGGVLVGAVAVILRAGVVSLAKPAPEAAS